MNEHLRATGRTTRMIEKAKELENEGYAVYVLTATHAHAGDLLKRLPKNTSIKVENSASVGGLDRLDWGRMLMPGMHPNCRVLVDHYAIERYIDPMMEELHRYD